MQVKEYGRKYQVLMGGNSMNRTTISIACAILVGFGSTFAVTAEDIPNRGPIPFTAYDTDNNGAISEQEFYAVRAKRMASRAEEGRPMRNAANSPQFSAFDSNGDGVLSQSELLAGQKGQMQQRGGMGRGMGMGPGGGRGPGASRPTFKEFDLNGDGELLEAEFNQAHSKRIVERAQQGYPMRGLSNMMQYSDMDADGNGKVTPEEFTSAQSTHWQLNNKK